MILKFKNFATQVHTVQIISIVETIQHFKLILDRLDIVLLFDARIKKGSRGYIFYDYHIPIFFICPSC